MRSVDFILGGDGYISFMMGAGRDGENCYVALCDGNNDEELIKVSNTSFDDPKFALTLLRTYMNAAAYAGKTAEATFTIVVMADRNSVADGGTGNPLKIPWHLAENLAKNQTRNAAVPERTVAVQADEAAVEPGAALKGDGAPEAEPDHGDNPDNRDMELPKKPKSPESRPRKTSKKRRGCLKTMEASQRDSPLLLFPNQTFGNEIIFAMFCPPPVPGGG